MSGNCNTNCPLDGPFFKEWTESLANDIKEIKEGIKTQNGRVRKLENWRSYIVGIGAILVFAIPIIISILVK